MMRLFDTHCHFQSADPVLISEKLQRARAAGVERILAVGGSPDLNEAAITAMQVAEGVYDMPDVLCALGYDRDQTGKPRQPVPECAMSAWGEIGLDYHYSADTRTEQIALFEEQLDEARRRGLPVVVHSREAEDDTFSILRASGARGVVHCFTGTPGFAERLLGLGFFISIAGVVTFRSAGYVRDAALVVPDDRLLIETDSPYLAPEPMRGGENEPAYIVHTCDFLAKLRGVASEELAERTFLNAMALFSPA